MRDEWTMTHWTVGGLGEGNGGKLLFISSSASSSNDDQGRGCRSERRKDPLS